MARSASTAGVGRSSVRTSSVGCSCPASTQPRLVVKMRWLRVQRSSAPLSKRSRTISLRPVIMKASGLLTNICFAGAVSLVTSCVYTPKVSPERTRSKSSSKRMRPLSVWTRAPPGKQGLLAVMRPLSGTVCQRLMVESNWMPGSAHSHAASLSWRMRSRALTVRSTSPPTRARNCHSASSSTACMKSSVRRTELFAFWYWIENESLPSRSMSKPASRNTRALRSSMALHQMNSSMSG